MSGTLSEGLFRAVFVNGVDAMGAATPTAKLRLLAEPGFECQTELIDTFTLLGDPAVAFYRGAEISRVNLPLVWKGMP